MKKNYLQIFARAFPYIIIVVYVAGLLASIAIGRYNFAISGSILAIPAIAASITLIHIYRCDQDYLPDSAPLFSFTQRTLVLLFGVSFFLTIVLGVLFPVKSPYFLGCIVALYIIILLHIFSPDLHPTVTLIEIMLTMASFIYEITLKSPYYFGWTDISPHIFMSTVTYLSGHIIPPDLSPGYAYFPLYHIWIALSSYILALNIKTTLFLITCPVYVMVTVFLYYLFKRVTRNTQISLLACLLYSIDSTVTFYGTYMISRVAAYIGFALLLYLLINRNNADNPDKKNILFSVLAILVTIFILLVHQVSTPQILFLLLLLIGCEWFVGAEKRIRNSFFLLEVIIFVAYWVYVAPAFVKYIDITRLNPEVFEAPVFESAPSLGLIVFLSNNIDVLIFIFFAIVGIGYLFWKRKIVYAQVFGLFALLTIVLYVPTPLNSIWQTLTLFQFDRFVLLISPFMAFVLSFGLYTVSEYLQKKISVRVARSIVLLIFVLYCCGSVGIIKAEAPVERYSFTGEELNGFTFIDSYVPYGSNIYSDYYTTTYFSQNYFGESNSLGVPFYKSQTIKNVMALPLYQGYVIITYDQFLNHGLAFSQGSELNPNGGTYPYLPSKGTISALSNNLAGKDKVFSSEFIDLYHS
jgi:hypothetical protein